MRKLLLPFLIFLAACSSKQDDKKIETNENNEYPVSMDGIGGIKLNMSQEELEKLLNRKIPLTNLTDTVSGSWQDSATIKYKEVDLSLDFQRTYTANDSFHMTVIGIRTSSPLCKTKPGIGVGADKSAIIAAYEDHYMKIIPELDGTNEPGKIRTSIIIHDEGVTRKLVFHMINKKVVKTETSIFFQDCE
jgi:hypothetical protein